MQEIDFLLDDQTNLALEMVNLKIRNQHAHQELEAFNNTGKFIYKHPLTVNTRYKQTQKDELRELKEKKPDEFLNLITNLKQNIRRIQSNINKKKYKDEQEHQSWLENIHNAKLRLQIIIELMK